MSRQWMWALAAVGACLLTVALPQANSGSSDEVANLVDMTVTTDAEGHPVVTLIGDGDLNYDSFVLDGPDRLVLDLESVINRLEAYRFPVGEGGVATVRAAQHAAEPEPVTRIVFDLEEPLPYQIHEEGSTLTVMFTGDPEGTPAPWVDDSAGAAAMWGEPAGHDDSWDGESGGVAETTTHADDWADDGTGPAEPAGHDERRSTALEAEDWAAPEDHQDTMQAGSGEPVASVQEMPAEQERPVEQDADYGHDPAAGREPAAAGHADEYADAREPAEEVRPFGTRDGSAMDDFGAAPADEGEMVASRAHEPAGNARPFGARDGSAMDDFGAAPADEGEMVASHDAEVDSPSGRSVAPGKIDKILKAPVMGPTSAAPQGSGGGSSAAQRDFETQTIVHDSISYSGKRISLNLVDADIKQVFRLFHEISGLNFVLDPEVSGRVTIVLDQVPWDQALDLILKNNSLDKVLEGNVLRIASTQKLAREAASRKQLKEAEELEVEPITLTRTLSYAKAKDVERIVREGGILSPRGKVIVDERTNTLIISDIPKKVDPLDALISTLDSETPQVMIEARIVESSRTFSQDLGVDWSFSAIADASQGTATGLNFPHNARVDYGLNLPTEDASTLGFSFSNIVDSFTLDLALRALETEGQGRVLSSPRVATQNNEQAEIEQGVRIPIVNTTATEIDVEFVSASLLLQVTPQITAEGTVILDVMVENNSPDFVNTAADIPSIRTQRAQTKVLISDGGTTVIGGIFFVSEASSEVGVPWFRKLPIFGWLFRSQNITNENRELLIFITPKIMRLS